MTEFKKNKIIALSLLNHLAESPRLMLPKDFIRKGKIKVIPESLFIRTQMCVVLRTRKDSCDDTRSQCMFETEPVSQKLIKEMGTHGDRDQSKLSSAQ